MQEAPYAQWAEQLEKIWHKHGIKPELICELGCGTGNITSILAKKGYDMIGIDLSEDMLAEARQKSVLDNTDILYLNQDMRAFELYGTVDSIIAMCDSMNYILDENELFNTFKLANNYLNPNGIFIFDLNTIYKFKTVLSDNSYCEASDDSAYIWENFYDEAERINEYCLNFFISNKQNGLYERFEELHYEKGYEADEIINYLSMAGFRNVSVYGELSFNPPAADSERIYFTAVK